jgi:hypothetical protein
MLGGPVAIPSSDDFKGVSVDQARVLHALGKARFWRMAIDPGTPPGLLKRQADAFFNSLFEAWSPQPSEAERTGFLQAFSRLLDSDPPQLQFWQMDRGAGEPYRATSLAMLKAMTTSAKDQLRAANESGSLKQAATDSGRAAAEAARQDADEAAREAAAAALEQ